MYNDKDVPYKEGGLKLNCWVESRQLVTRVGVKSWKVTCPSSMVLNCQ